VFAGRHPSDVTPVRASNSFGRVVSQVDRVVGEAMLNRVALAAPSEDPQDQDLPLRHSVGDRLFLLCAARGALLSPVASSVLLFHGRVLRASFWLAFRWHPPGWRPVSGSVHKNRVSVEEKNDERCSGQPAVLPARMENIKPHRIMPLRDAYVPMR